MNDTVKTPEAFKNGATWIKADFHLHTKADKEFAYSGEENSFVKDYVQALKDADIKAGNSNARNPVLASFANHILPYRGYGSGILRALKSYPAIDFIDDRDGNLFKVIIKREQ